jgi:hypothetical protein
LDQWKQPSDLAAIIAGDFNCQENLHWGTDPGWTSCPDWRDIGLSRTGNDLKLCRYIAKSFANVSGTYDKDMVLARNDNQPWGNPMGGGKVPNNWNDQSCSDHDIVYAGFMIGCSCPKDQFCFGSINSGQCKPCPPCEPGRCGKGCRICTCPTGQYCDTQGYCQLLGQSCTYNAQCKYGCWQRHCWPGPCYVGQKVCCGGDICTTKSTCPKCP